MNRLPRFVLFPVAALLAVVTLSAQVDRPVSPQGPPTRLELAYYPTRSEWQTRKPSEVGMDEALLAQAIEFAKTLPANFGRTDYLADQIRTFGRPLGPVPPSHQGMNGIIVRRGYVVAEFGDTTVVEPTYSVAKSYLSALFGLARDRGLIKSVTDPVKSYINDGGYDSPHNATITWEHHLRQASEWEGTLFGKPSTFLGVEEFGTGQMQPRDLREPGSFYEYNDVRVNRFSLSLLRVWKRPLPEVLKTEIMDPIGATDTWKWLGYDNSDVDVDGRMITSVPGGTRWGGGIWMSSRDHARFGLLMLRNGTWNDKQLVSSSWIKEATTQGGPAADYGYLWWLNTKGGKADLPRTSYSAQGNGSNSIFIDPEHDLVVVWRWYGGRRSENEFFKRIIAAIGEK